MANIYDLDNEYGGKIISDSGNPGAALEVQSGAAAQPAILAAHNVVGSMTVAPLQLSVPSRASGAVLQVTTGFVSITSILVASAAHTDYAIPVQVGLETRYIPVWKAAGIIGAAARP